MHNEVGSAEHDMTGPFPGPPKAHANSTLLVKMNETAEIRPVLAGDAEKLISLRLARHRIIEKALRQTKASDETTSQLGRQSDGLNTHAAVVINRNAQGGSDMHATCQSDGDTRPASERMRLEETSLVIRPRLWILRLQFTHL